MISTILRPLVCLLLSALLGLSLATPVAADAGRFLTTTTTAELQAEIDGLNAAGGPNPTPEQQSRLEDLNQLALAIRRSDGRAQLRNDSTHNIGLYLRYKKDPPNTPAPLRVLGPDQESDDDYELVAFYVPEGVTLQWGQRVLAAAPGPLLARVLEGQRLRLGDGVVDAVNGESRIGYTLNLPVFSLLQSDASSAVAADVPSLSQADLDAQIPDAPTD